VLILLLTLLPLIGWTSLAFFTPSVYHNTFLAELPEKYDRLSTLQGRRIVVVGGSSVAFGINSKQMQEQLGLPVVNFGLYASLGSKVMLDLSRDAVHAGDIVVLAFEADNQTLSMYFNAESMWQAVDCDPKLLLHMGGDNLPQMAGGMFEYVKDKVYFLREGAPKIEGVYSKSSFDVLGDICYPRAKNIMPSGFDANNPVDFSKIEIEADFSDYVNEYIEELTDQGAEVCFSFCPMNDRAVSGNSQEDKEAFVKYLSDSFHCPMISRIDDYIYPSDYFYDTNFHLNDIGAPIHSQQLARDIAQHFDMELAQMKPPEMEETTEPPTQENSEEAEETIDPEINAEFTDCFTYEAYYEAGWAIAGVTEEAIAARELGIPSYYEGQKVVAVLEGAFAGCDELEEIRISCAGEDTVTIHDGAFSGLPALKRVVLDAEPTAIKISTGGLLKDVVSEPKFYVPKALYAKYVTDYYWSIYGNAIKPAD